MTLTVREATLGDAAAIVNILNPIIETRKYSVMLEPVYSLYPTLSKNSLNFSNCCVFLWCIRSITCMLLKHHSLW